jgi:hypothetical protein
MRSGRKEIAIALLAASAVASIANAQTSYPCVNDAPNPYRQVAEWEQMPRHWAATNNVYVDGNDHIWVMDRCEPKGCVGSNESPIWELSADGKSMKNFGAGIFGLPAHGQARRRREHLGDRRRRQGRQGQSDLQVRSGR